MTLWRGRFPIAAAGLLHHDFNRLEGDSVHTALTHRSPGAGADCQRGDESVQRAGSFTWATGASSHNEMFFSFFLFGVWRISARSQRERTKEGKKRERKRKTEKTRKVLWVRCRTKEKRDLRKDSIWKNGLKVGSCLNVNVTFTPMIVFYFLSSVTFSNI